MLSSVSMGHTYNLMVVILCKATFTFYSIAILLCCSRRQITHNAFNLYLPFGLVPFVIRSNEEEKKIDGNKNTDKVNKLRVGRRVLCTLQFYFVQITFIYCYEKNNTIFFLHFSSYYGLTNSLMCVRIL